MSRQVHGSCCRPEIVPDTFFFQIDLAGEDDDVSDQEDLLMGYMRAADTLRVAYETEELTSSNLPPYDRLVPSQG